MEINSNNVGKKNTLNTIAKAFMIVGLFVMLLFT